MREEAAHLALDVPRGFDDLLLRQVREVVRVDPRPRLRDGRPGALRHLQHQLPEPGLDIAAGRQRRLREPLPHPGDVSHWISEASCRHTSPASACRSAAAHRARSRRPSASAARRHRSSAPTPPSRARRGSSDKRPVALSGSSSLPHRLLDLADIARRPVRQLRPARAIE